MNRVTRPIPKTSSGLWHAAVIVVAGVLAYANSLTGPFILDDHTSILENTRIRDLSKPGTVLSPQREAPTAGRPLVNLSFAANYAVGGLNVLGYHIVNIGCHLLTGLLLFGIVRRTLALTRLNETTVGLPPPDRTGRSSGKPPRSDSKSVPKARFDAAVTLAFVTALLWTLHPLNTEAVNYVTQRTELMMGVFYLLTLYASIRASQERRVTWAVIAVLACFAGMGSKESMATAPVVVVLYDAIFVFRSLKKALVQRWRFYAPLFLSWFLLLVLIWSGPRSHSAGFSTDVSSWTYLLNQGVMITEYLRRAIWPRSLVALYGLPLPVGISQVWPYVLFVAALFALTLTAAVRFPQWAFLGIWFFLTLAPTSSILPIATEVGAERRMYLPLMAVVAFAVTAAACVNKVLSVRGAVAAGVVACLLGIATFERNRDYSSELRLARTAIERYPTSLAHHILGTNLIREGRSDEAVSELRLALPGDPRAHYTLGMELFKRREVDGAAGELQAFLRERPELLEAVSARLVLGQAFLAQKRWPDAIEQAQLVLTMNPSNTQRLDARGLIGQAFFDAQKFEEAVPALREYVRLRPGDVGAWSHLGVALIGTGKLDEGVVAFRRAVELAPADPDAQGNLGRALFARQEYAEAAVHAQRAVDLRPASADAHEMLGRDLALLGRFDEARAHFERALQIDPAHAEAKDDLRKLQLLLQR